MTGFWRRGRRVGAWRRGIARGVGPAAERDGLLGLGDLLLGFRSVLSNAAGGWRAFRSGKHWRRAGPVFTGIPFNLRRTLSVAATLFVLVFLTHALLEWAEPLGLNRATQAHSERLSARFMAPFYHSGAQDRIAVVLIDDATVQARGVGWPPQYTFYAAMLERIVEHRPAAIFVDVLIEDERPYDPSLENAREWLADVLEGSGVPVFFAASEPGRDGLFAGLPHVGSAVVSWQGMGGDYPLQVGGANAVRWSGPLQGGPADTPAVALYDIACAPGEGKDPLPRGCAQLASALDGSEREGPMVLQWGHRRPVLPESASSVAAATCARAPGEAYSPWRAFFSEMVKGLRSGTEPGIWEARRETCPYTLTFHEEALPAPGTDSPLAGRVVLVGARLAGLDDAVVSPTHQKLPGVYMHAMALDNLMTWGDRHLRRSGGIQFIAMVLGMALASLVLALVLRHTRRWLQWTLLIVAGGAFALLPAWLLQAYWRQPPLDWVEVLTLFGLMSFLARARIRRQAHTKTGGTA